MLEALNENEFETEWKNRNGFDKHIRKGMRSQIWDECERRYEEFSRIPVEFRLPYFRTLSMRMVKIENRLMVTKFGHYVW